MSKTKITVKALLLSLIITAGTFAQGGKLVGKITDAATGEPVIGANIIIAGTTMGAATNIDGRYLILNIPPGKYEVRASMIGYAKVTKTEVDITIDRTTELSFQLEDESVQITEVVVIAGKPPVVKDRTSTTTSISDEQIKAAPIEGLRGALDLSAGFQKDATGNYSVRGSGAYEVNFQINGVEQSTSNTSAPGTFGTDKADNSWKYDVNPLGVQQLQLITGGFSAEYGNAQAGVVKVVLKEGAPRFTGEARVEYRPPGKYHHGEYIYSKNSYEWQKWGNLETWMVTRRQQIIDELKLDVRFGNLKNADPRLYEQKINEEIRWAYDLWVKNHEPGEDNVLGVYDYTQYAYTRYLFGFGGPLGKNPNLLKFYVSGEYKRNPTRLPTPEKVQVAQNYILNINYQPATAHKIKLMGSYQNYKGGIWSGSDDIRWSGLAFSPPGVSTKYLITLDPVRDEQTVTQSLNWIYTISTNSFADLTITHQSERYEIPFQYLAGYGLEVDRADSLGDPLGTVLREGSWWEKDYYRAPFGFSTNYYQDSRTETYNLKLDYTNQIIETNLLKAGLRFSYWDMINNGVNSSFQANSYVARNGFADYYKAYPINIAGYFQDKMEYEGMIANIGVRAEAYNFQSQVPLDMFNVLYPGTDGPGKTGSPETKGSDWKYIILPRIGVSFPIGTGTAFRFQYGHFSSMPVFSQALSRKTWVGWQGIANANLDPKISINYEFGLQQALGTNHRLDLVLYYNDRATQVGTQSIASYTGSRNQFAGFSSDNIPLYYYTTYTNNAFGSTVGFEATFETVTLTNWGYRLSYSLSQTTVGNYGSQSVFPEGTRNPNNRGFTGEFLASWDRTHNFRGLIQYFTRENEGFEFLGVRPFENSIISLTYTAQSGTPFTYVTEFDLRDVVNNRRYPIESSVDLNFTKDIKISGYKVILGIRVMNLFNNQWITPMSTSEDIRLWIEEGITMSDAGNDPLRLSHIVAPFRAFRNLPRQIFFTFGVGI